MQPPGGLGVPFFVFWFLVFGFGFLVFGFLVLGLGFTPWGGIRQVSDALSERRAEQALNRYKQIYNI